MFAFAGLFAGPSSTSPLGQLLQQLGNQDDDQFQRGTKYYTHF